MKLKDFPNGSPFKFASGQSFNTQTTHVAAAPHPDIRVTSGKGTKDHKRVYVDLDSGTLFVADTVAADAEVVPVQDKTAPTPKGWDWGRQKWENTGLEAQLAPSTTVFTPKAPRPLNKERYYHIPIKGHPRVKYVTVYAKEIDMCWYTDLAYCAKGDNFSREIGRAVARNRFQLNPMHGGGKGHGSWGSVRPSYEDVVYWARRMADVHVK